MFYADTELCRLCNTLEDTIPPGTVCSIHACMESTKRAKGNCAQGTTLTLALLGLGQGGIPQCGSLVVMQRSRSLCEMEEHMLHTHIHKCSTCIVHTHACVCPVQPCMCTSSAVLLVCDMPYARHSWHGIHTCLFVNMSGTAETVVVRWLQQVYVRC
jgi:hypothetical protein